MNDGALILGALTALLAGAILTPLVRSRRLAEVVFLAAAWAGCALGAAAALRVLTGAPSTAATLPWPVPAGALHLRFDPLGAWFGLAVCIVSASTALYSVSYLRAVADRRFARYAVFFPILVASLLALAAARNALLFLAAWELMTLSAYFSIIHRHEDPAIRGAGLLYIVANHTAAFCLIALVAWLGAQTGSLEFQALRASAAAQTAGVGVPLVLALVAFGTKAGMMPFHIWLPHAHPAAPSPISALLSGIVIKSGIFGLLRFLPLLPPLPTWTGVVILAAGAVSGVVGVLYALAQHELKRLLAYHSVENIGIILLGVGMGMIGSSTGHPDVAVLGFAGALLHLLNHALFKALLFLGAGAVIHARGTGDIDRLGGVGKALPHCAFLFLVGCVSICGLPPCNGFVSEWSLYRAMFTAATGGSGGAALSSAGAILTLALIGGLAAACFAKAFAAVFLGTPREPHASHATGEAAAGQRLAMALLAALCLLIGLFPQLALRLVWPAATDLAAAFGGHGGLDPAPWAGWLRSLSAIGVLLVAVISLLVAVRARLAPGAPATTWGCGYPVAGPRMQYTSASFAAPLLAVFRGLLFPHAERRGPGGWFARSPAMTTHTPDAPERFVFRPAYAALRGACRPFRVLQLVPVQVQVLFVMIALASLLLWKVTL